MTKSYQAKLGLIMIYLYPNSQTMLRFLGNKSK